MPNIATLGDDPSVAPIEAYPLAVETRGTESVAGVLHGLHQRGVQSAVTLKSLQQDIRSVGRIACLLYDPRYALWYERPEWGGPLASHGV